MALSKRQMIIATTSSLVIPSQASAFLPFAFRFLFSTAIRGSASLGAGVATRTVVTRTFVSAGVQRTVQVVATKEFGITMAGANYLSLAAAQAIETHDCKAICVIGVDGNASVVADTPVRQSMNLTFRIIALPGISSEVERGVYVAPGEFKYSIDFPQAMSSGAKRLEGSSPDNLITPFASPNFYLAHPSELFQ